MLKMKPVDKNYFINTYRTLLHEVFSPKLKFGWFSKCDKDCICHVLNTLQARVSDLYPEKISTL